MVTLSCSAAPGSGGLGRHIAELLEEAHRSRQVCRYYSTSAPPDQPVPGEVVGSRTADWLCTRTPFRFSSGWRAFLHGDLFDRGVAARLAGTEAHVGFAGQAGRTFLRARELGAARLELVAATSHVDNVARRNAEARRRWPIEGHWLNEAHRRKALREYEMADVIQVTSEYSLRSFLERGVAPERLRRWMPSTDPRFRPPTSRPEDGVFRIVYVGALSVTKGVPVLIEAMRRLAGRDVELTLVGGYGSRGMRRYVQEALARDRRIHLAPGDPLPHLQRADVLVHPSYQEGFGYAPAEALACGVRVIVSEDTGMKELVRPGVNGWVVPTGSSEAIVERLEAMMAGGRAAAAV
jgi:glycosyltransferase involved in cell wall biosynthesis